MKDTKFFDTNILCYAYGTQDPAKRRICKGLVERVFDGELDGVVSGQVLGEFFSAATGKWLMPVEEVRTVIRYIIASERWQKIDYTHKTVETVLQRLDASRAPFWDAMIAQTMKENGIQEIITENELDFARISGIKITNPFRS